MYKSALLGRTTGTMGYMYIPKTALRLFAIAVLFVSFAGYSFLKADWTPPTAAPPANNVDVPINTGTANQIKNGSISLNGLALITDYPTIAFVDPRPGHRTLYMQNHSNTFNLLGDRNGDGNVVWADDQPVAFATYLGTTPSQDYTYISNQVRATQYCDSNGQNCFRSMDVANQPLTYGGDYIYFNGTTGTNANPAYCVQSNAFTGRCACPANYKPVLVRRETTQGSCGGSQQNCSSVPGEDTFGCISQ